MRCQMAETAPIREHFHIILYATVLRKGMRGHCVVLGLMWMGEQASIFYLYGIRLDRPECFQGATILSGNESSVRRAVNERKFGNSGDCEFWSRGWGVVVHRSLLIGKHAISHHRIARCARSSAIEENLLFSRLLHLSKFAALEAHCNVSKAKNRRLVQGSLLSMNCRPAILICCSHTSN